MAVLLACAGLVAAAALTLLTPAALAWPSHMAILVVAAYACLSMASGTRSLALVAALWPALAISSARAFHIPMASMLSRLPELHGEGSLPPLWAKGGIALLPIMPFALTQAWLVVRLVHVAKLRFAKRTSAALLAAGLVTAVSVVACFAAIVVGVVCAGVSVDAGLFPRSRNPYFGLFWMSVTIGLLQPASALLGGIFVQRRVAGAAGAAGDVAPYERSSRPT